MKIRGMKTMGEQKNKVILCNDIMKKYYQEFDPIEYKYGNFYDDVIDKKDKHYFLKKAALIQELTKHEQSKNFADLTKKDFEYTISNLKMIYGDEEFAQYVVTMYHLIYTKVISLYINIDGIERLFNDKYANFEWELHLGMDYDSHDMNYYRDHFIHQIKDAYTIDRLLENLDYLDVVKTVLKNQSNSKISAFVTKYINIQLEKPDFFTDKFQRVSEFRKREYFLENIIKMSGYMAALFHDIGYPIVANIKGNQNIMDYIFETYNLNDCNINFDKITALLGNSLLFRVESISRIRKRVEGNPQAGQKIDHGAVSAIIFLLHFYENGAIHRLEPYKVCAVELAGLAIFNHTNEYTYISGKKKDYERNVFFQNPISHLLRISDDLQEWGRIYFQISDQSNLIICNRCKTPIIRIKNKDFYGEYRCHCKDNPQNVNFSRAFKEEGFPYRRIYKVTICKDVTIKHIDDVEYVDLHYDLGRLLHIAYISPTYAKYRSKELSQIKRLFMKQKLPFATYVRCFMSANIIAIKSEIAGQVLLEDELEKNVSEIKAKLNCEEQTGNIDEILSYYQEQNYIGEDNKVISEINAIENENAKEYLLKALKLYCDFYVTAYIISLYNEKGLTKKKKVLMQKTENFIDHYKKENGLDSESDVDVSFLLDDYFRYAGNRFLHLEEYSYFPEEYFNEFKSEDELYIRICSFCDTGTHQFEEFPDKGIDAYNDLYLFKILEKIYSEKERERKNRE